MGSRRAAAMRGGGHCWKMPSRANASALILRSVACGSGRVRSRCDACESPAWACWLVSLFADDFDSLIRLAGEVRPRYKGRGLVTAADVDRETVKPEDRAQEWVTVCLSLAAKCPACGLVGQWSAMCIESPKPKRAKRGARELALAGTVARGITAFEGRARWGAR